MHLLCGFPSNHQVLSAQNCGYCASPSRCRDQDEVGTELRPVLAVLLEAAGVGLTAVSMLENLQPDLQILLGCTDGSTALLSQSAIEVFHLQPVTHQLRSLWLACTI